MSEHNDIAISVQNLSKAYKLYNKPVDRMKESLHPLRKKYHHDFFALNDISFEVKKGETVGIIGKNGSGKSTLLKILTGVLTPTSGNLKIDGRLSALLELGAGFNPEFTGVENVYFNGSIMGYTRAEMDAKIDDILSFADIGEFVNQPVKMYSSGMFARLAFALAINVDPEILIIDEALSVGDIFFQSKCMKRMKDMIDNKVTLIFVSHDLLSIKRITEKTLWLDKGIIKGYGLSNYISERYSAFLIEEKENVKEILVLENNNVDISQNLSWGDPKKRMGTGEAIIEKIMFNGDLLSALGVVSLNTFDSINLEIYFKIINTDINSINISIVFFDSDGLYCSGFCTNYDNVIVDIKKEQIKCKIHELPLLRGGYSLSVSLWDQFIKVPYDLHERMYDINIISPCIKDEGFLYMKHTWE